MGKKLATWKDFSMVVIILLVNEYLHYYTGLYSIFIILVIHNGTNTYYMSIEYLHFCTNTY